MTSYSLNIAFEKEDANLINSINQKVVLVKQTASSSSNNNVAWVTFDPFENNTVSWTEEYSVYASTSEVQNGAVIQKLSVEEAADGNVYDFVNNVFHLDTSLTIPKSSYGIYNSTNKVLTFGLAQDVTVNNGFFKAAPINAASVLGGQDATFTPLTQVLVFLQNSYQDGVVLTRVFSQTYKAVFGDGNFVVNLLYRNGNFVKV
ncbi:hypothetical protein SD70_09010 [Gordoniibacillus kamchatkensis]|uniref:Uncharacterized protein n=1 Tax=Gordoniibacillus kamchatkensis TaxID=1590651 RepID=A0ABR5AJC9_9BACL|nr:hypothetical protein [Paenibacillus sp. VKM B-2647]KIL41160.1 hypothetical protein SD70_09010 [Paenibacillus sp. VKM B-2647]